jgi:hypothetical protein
VTGLEVWVALVFECMHIKEQHITTPKDFAESRKIADDGRSA